ncbi:MAG: DUF2298 domain-containing protein [Methanolinea sp.]|jgi:YYY domain-containing protein|nr:DUF2298 domain-containing protein [Methanolinea sp.]
MHSRNGSEGYGLAGYEFQALAVVSWLLLLFFLHLALWPYLKGSFREFAYPVSFPASILIFTLISWYCGLLRLPILLALVPFAVLFLHAAWKGAYKRSAFAGQGVWAFLFLLFFFAMVSVRFTNPSISYAEKFMDHAFLASIMRIPVVPPLDPWFLGGYLDVYYYLGYWIFGVLGLTCGVPSSITFNLALPTVLGLSAMMMFALGRLLTRRYAYLTLATFLVVNPSFIWQVIQGKTLGAVLWDSTRTIPDTINEYPLFSFLWGDVHPHVIGIFNQVFFLFILVYAWVRWSTLGPRERLLVIVLSGISLGSMPLINTWDVIVYAPVTILFGLMIWYRGGEPSLSPGAGNLEILLAAGRRVTAGVVAFLKCRYWKARLETVPFLRGIAAAPCAFLLLVPPIAVLSYLPFYLQMNTRGIQGVGLVHTPTSPVDFLLVHGFFLLLMVIYLARDIRERPWLLVIPFAIAVAGYSAAALAALPLVYLLARRTRAPAEILAILGLSIVIMCEVFYLVDNMGETYYRMNTLFKFYIAAWLLMGSSSFAMLGTMLDRWRGPVTFPAWLSRAALVALSVALLITPLVLPLDSPYRGATLDGLEYVISAHPGDADAVAFLRTLPGNLGIVEAVGGDYTYYSRVSSFTGIPAVIGWTFHEFMWRDDADGWYGDRIADVKTIYEQPDQTTALMQAYNATHLYVGELEREQYSVRVHEAGLPLLYDRGGVQIYALPA